MIINTSAGRNHRTEEFIEYSIEDKLSKYTETEKNEFAGRLIDLLVTKGVITVAEAGNLLYEDWAP